MMTDNRAPAPPVLKALFSDMTTDAVNKSSEDVEMKPYDYELIQKIPSAIEAIDALVNPLFEFSDNDEVSEKQFRIKCKDAGSLAYKLFEKLYESRQTLDALQSVIPILKDELKKRDEEDKKKDAELMKLRQVVDKVKRNTEEMSELSKELTNISLGVSLDDKSYAGAVGQNSKQVHRRGKVAPIPASANALKTAVKAIFYDEDRKKNIILFGLGEEDNESLKDKVGKVLLEVNQKPRLRQVVRLGQQMGRCRPVRVSLENSDTVHSILKDSTKFKTSTMYSKVFISPDRTPEERIEHSELVREMKSKIQSDSSKHWKINKGKVVSVEIETPEVIAEQETSVKIESPEEKVVREKQEERRSRLARSPMRSPMPVRRIAEQETPVKIESPEEKVLREKKVAERRLRLARSPPPVRRICKPVQRYGTGTDY